jgi:hypothetical protein
MRRRSPDGRAALFRSGWRQSRPGSRRNHRHQRRRRQNVETKPRVARGSVAWLRVGQGHSRVTCLGLQDLVWASNPSQLPSSLPGQVHGTPPRPRRSRAGSRAVPLRQPLPTENSPTQFPEDPLAFLFPWVLLRPAGALRGFGARQVPSQEGVLLRPALPGGSMREWAKSSSINGA